jgi:hypothetical protein
MGILTAFATGFVDAANQARNEKEQAEYEAMINARDQKQKESFYKFTSDLEAKADKDYQERQIAADIAAKAEAAEVEASQIDARWLQERADRDEETERLEAARLRAIEGLVPKDMSDEDRAFLAENYNPQTLATMLDRGDVYKDGSWIYIRDVRTKQTEDFFRRMLPEKWRGVPGMEALWATSQFVKDGLNAVRRGEMSAIEYANTYYADPRFAEDDEGLDRSPIGWDRVSTDDERFYKPLSTSEADKFDLNFFAPFSQVDGVVYYSTEGGFQGPQQPTRETARMLEAHAAAKLEIERTPLHLRPSIMQRTYNRAWSVIPTLQWFSDEHEHELNITLGRAEEQELQEDADIINALDILAHRSAFDNAESIQRQQDLLLNQIASIPGNADQRERIEDVLDAKLARGQDILPEEEADALVVLSEENGIVTHPGTISITNRAGSLPTYSLNEVGISKMEIAINNFENQAVPITQRRGLKAFVMAEFGLSSFSYIPAQLIASYENMRSD